MPEPTQESLQHLQAKGSYPGCTCPFLHMSSHLGPCTTTAAAQPSHCHCTTPPCIHTHMHPAGTLLTTPAPTFAPQWLPHLRYPHQQPQRVVHPRGRAAALLLRRPGGQLLLQGVQDTQGPAGDLRRGDAVLHRWGRALGTGHWALGCAGRLCSLLPGVPLVYATYPVP
jgi:hypothetical protein